MLDEVRTRSCCSSLLLSAAALHQSDNNKHYLDDITTAVQHVATAGGWPSLRSHALAGFADALGVLSSYELDLVVEEVLPVFCLSDCFGVYVSDVDEITADHVVLIALTIAVKRDPSVQRNNTNRHVLRSLRRLQQL